MDNNSSDNSVEFVKKNFRKVKIILLDKNYGFAKGNNIGFEKSNGGYILLLNNDTYLQKNTLKVMVEEIEKTKDAGILQPKMLLTRNKGLDACGGFLTNTGFLYHYGLYENPSTPAYNKKTLIFSVKGACVLVSREVIERIGLFDEDFFCYFEETDFCHRAWLAGYKVYYAPKATMYHIKGGTATKMEKGKMPALFQFHAYKNRICSYLKNLGLRELIKILPLHLVFIILLSIFYFVKGETKISKALLESIWWNILNIKRTMRKRKQVQEKIRVVDDREIRRQVYKKASLAYCLSELKRMS